MDFIKVIAYTLIYLLSLFEIVLVVRAICSWVPYFRESRVSRIANTISEPIIAPIRNMLMNISFVRRCPIDHSFLVLYIFIRIASSVLTAFVYYV